MVFYLNDEEYCVAIYYSTNQSTVNQSTDCSVASKVYPLRAVRSPQADYETDATEKDLQDQLENLLAIYHYHQTALLELARNETVPDSADWEYGAYLLGKKLKLQSEILLKQLPGLKNSN